MSGRQILLPEGVRLFDGVVALRAYGPGDRPVLIAGRDAAFHRWLGAGSDDPRPTASIEYEGQLIGWIDADDLHAWLHPGEVNVGYNVFATARGRGCATRALQLLMHFLGSASYDRGDSPPVTHAVLLIDPGNTASLGVARRAGFTLDPTPREGEPPGQLRFVRPIPPWRYDDGVVALRPQRPGDEAMHVASVDAEQQRWLWLPENVASWADMDEPARRAHTLMWFAENAQRFATGPTWGFAIDLLADSRCGSAECVGYIECDLTNPHVPHGEANISYSVHPDYRGRGIATRAVDCMLRFLREHTGARQAQLRVDAHNLASLAVAARFGTALPTEQEGDRSFHRRVIELR